MNQKVSFNNKREYEWLVISQSYLQCALMNARILSEKLRDFAITENSPLDFCFKKIYGDYPQSPEYLIFPILFNFKHGIEIYLKSIIGVKDSKFSKGHNLLDFLETANIKDEKIKGIIKKHAYSLLFLPDNEEPDAQNQFERYPQGNPYDDLWLFPAVNEYGQNVSEPKNIGFEGYIKWMQENNLEIESVITQEKVDELVEDIEFLMLGLRKISHSNS